MAKVSQLLRDTSLHLVDLDLKLLDIFVEGNLLGHLARKPVVRKVDLHGGRGSFVGCGSAGCAGWWLGMEERPSALA
jgi:hypothetical protein